MEPVIPDLTDREVDDFTAAIRGEDEAPVLYYGPPGREHHCAFTYKDTEGKPRPGFRCPDYIAFYVKVPDGRGDDWRKAWASCVYHLCEVILQMQVAHKYDGELLLRAEPLTEQEEDEM